MQFPHVDTNSPLSEHSSNIRLFCLGFPWLFPGGIGDIKDVHKVPMSNEDWCDLLVHYFDGRFEKDKMWCFYALNYLTQKKNDNSETYFVSGKFFTDVPDSLDDLKNRISSGDLSWIERINYYSQNVTGSSSYWRSQRHRVNAWIDHHIEQGHGPPTFFMTLSCAEYHWPDVKRLLKERLEKGPGIPEDFDKNFVKYANEHTVVVQDYFQQRVKIWLETIGKHVFKINHYWLHFEFAPSHGQIHAHFIAICDLNKIKFLYDESFASPEDKAEIISKWAKKCFEMTAMVDENLTKLEIEKMQEHPSRVTYTECNNDHNVDSYLCQKTLQWHSCSKYCLK